MNAEELIFSDADVENGVLVDVVKVSHPRGPYRVRMLDMDACQAVGVFFCPTEEMAMKEARKMIHN